MVCSIAAALRRLSRRTRAARARRSLDNSSCYEYRCVKPKIFSYLSYEYRSLITRTLNYITHAKAS